MKESKLNSYYIDFDLTICNSHFNEETGHYDMGEPMPYMIDAVNRCDKEIVIFTARPEEEWGEVKDWLDAHEVKHSGITNVKKPALRYVDDRAMSPEVFIGVYGKR